MADDSTPYRYRPPRRVIRGADDPTSLLQELQAANYQGPRLQMLTDDLWVYGWDVMRGMVRTGTIARVQTGLPHRTMTVEDRQTLHDSAEQRETLIVEALMKAVPTFPRLLASGFYDPDKSALASYFTGWVTRHFWSAYKQWSIKRHRELTTLAALRAQGPELEPYQDLALTHDQRQALLVILKKATVEQKAIMLGLATDQTHAAIGAKMGLTSKAVEYRVARLRDTAWGLVERGRINPALVPGSRAAQTSARTPAQSRQR